MKIVQFMIGRAGGAETFFIKLSKALAEKGVEQHLIVNEGAQLTLDAKASGLPVTVLPVSKWLDIPGRLLLRRTLKAEVPDIVMVWMNRAARRLGRGPYVTVGRLGGWYPVRNYRTCDWLIGNTPGVLRHIVEDGWPAERAVMISNFGELPDAPAVDRSALGVPGDAFLIMALGRLDYSKGFDVLIDAMARLPGRVHLRIAGKGPVEDDLIARVKAAGLEGRIGFLGWRTDQAALLKAADLCVFPSREEPLGNVTLEAWSVGTPVVATRCEGQAWLIDDGRDGLLAEPGDVGGLAAAIARVVGDSELLRAFAIAGQAKWRSEYSRQVICDRYIGFFERILAEKRDRN